MEAHGGKVAARSRPEEGFTVEFTIPGWKAPAGKAGKRRGAAQVS
ncbi:MAG: hypothetical protein ACKOBH_07370 [bacterium]